jgi:hypothetical protein
VFADYAAQPPADIDEEFWSIKTIVAKTGLSRTTIYDSPWASAGCVAGIRDAGVEGKPTEVTRCICSSRKPWRSEVGPHEKHSRAMPSLFFGADEKGGVESSR